MDHTEAVIAELPLISREFEVAAIYALIDGLKRGRGGAVVITGESGIGKTRMLGEARRKADLLGLLVLRGRAVESGGAYRPLVEAFARAAAPFAEDPQLAGIRATLARVLPGWQGVPGQLPPMADPAAVLAEALTIVLQTIAPEGSVLLIDDLHWADQDTLSVLSSLVEATEELPLGLIMTAREEPVALSTWAQLTSTRSVQNLALRRLPLSEVEDQLRTTELAAPDSIAALVAAADGLPLVLDELVRHAHDHPSDPPHTGSAALATTVRQRLARVSSPSRVLLDALSVIGEADAEVVMAATGLTDSQLVAALHEGLSSTLLVTSGSPLGVTWRHPLIAAVVRESLLPLERQALARRGAERLASETPPTDGQLRQSATLYELAGYPQLAAQQFVAAARIAVQHAALGAAEDYLSQAHRLTGEYQDTAREVLVERIEMLTMAGQADDAYHSGVEALRSSTNRDNHALLAATIRAAFTAKLTAEGSEYLTRLEAETVAGDIDVAVLRARAAYLQRRTEAETLADKAAATASAAGRFDLACEALITAGAALHRTDLRRATQVFQRAHIVSREHHLVIWEIRALAQLGEIDAITNSDADRLHQARAQAAQAGMVGLVAELDLRISQVICIREGHIAGYPTVVRADTEARRLRLTSLYAESRLHLADCISYFGDSPLPGWTRPATRADFDALIDEAVRLGEVSRPVPWAKGTMGIRAWLDGDSTTAFEYIVAGTANVRDEVKAPPWWGVGMLLRSIASDDPEEAFGAPELLGHHGNKAAYAYANALFLLRRGKSCQAVIDEAEHHARQAPFLRHMLRTIVAPDLSKAGFMGAESWLREADAFCIQSGERAMQHRVRAALTSIGAKLPRGASAAMPPSLARLQITAREAEILRLISVGMSNNDIAQLLVLSVRTVESHVSSLLAKSGLSTRSELRQAFSRET
jgi:DNA-binding CsgD family transcriptional regulator